MTLPVSHGRRFGPPAGANITRFTIRNGDTLEAPQLLENGQVRKFDRVLANPPFSQNYSRANMQFPNRFREWCPESGKKADLMFVQHIAAYEPDEGERVTAAVIKKALKALIDDLKDSPGRSARF